MLNVSNIVSANLFGLLALSVKAGLANSIDLQHIYMPMDMRGLTISVPRFANSIDLLHIYMPMDMRGLGVVVFTDIHHLGNYGDSKSIQKTTFHNSQTKLRRFVS